MGTRLSRESLASGVLAGSSCHILYPPTPPSPWLRMGAGTRFIENGTEAQAGSGTYKIF